jgi:hypothetical protein
MRKMLLALLLAAGLFVSAWAAEFRMVNKSDLVPSATGKVEVKQDDNGNRKVKVHVYHLADPEKLTPARSAYMVWLEPKGKDPEPLGTLKVDKDLKAEIEGTTPYKIFSVVVTAEENPKAERPEGAEILHADVE